MASKLASRDHANPLQINDLVDLLLLLKRHGYSGVTYYDLGLFLGLLPGTLDVIKENDGKDVLACLRECLKAWLQKKDDVVVRGGPTIYSLVSALKEIQHNAVADGIDTEVHPACKILARYMTSEQSIIVSALPQLALLLHSEKLIKEMMLLPINEHGEALLTDIKVAVCIDYCKLEAFAEILCKVTATVGIGKAIKKEYKKKFYSNDSLMTNGTVSTAEELKIYFPQSMIAEFKTMRLKFGKTFSSVKDIMKANPPALEKMRDILIFSYRALKPQLAKCEDIHSILELISENCSLNDISMLKFFVDESEINGLAKIVVQEYNEALKKFSETKLSQYLEGKISYASPLQCEKITIVIDVDENAEELMLKDVKRLSADIFHDLSPNVRLNVIRDGNSFAVTCSFPLILSDHLIAAALNNINILKENRVKKMIIGYYTVYEVNDTSTPTTKQQYASLSARPSSNLSKQLMLSLKIQLINSEEEVATLNEESKVIKENVASLKETLEAKSKMLSANIAESNKFKELAAETQMLQKKVSHLTEESEGLKEKKKILEEQLASFQSKKGDIEDKEERKIEKLQSTDTTFEIETLRKILKQKDEEIKQERAAWSKEKKLLLEKITTMNLQLIEKDKLVQEKEQVLRLTIENLEKGERRHLDDVSAKGSTSDSAHFPITKNENDSHDSSESQNSEQEKKEMTGIWGLFKKKGGDDVGGDDVVLKYDVNKTGEHGVVLIINNVHFEGKDIGDRKSSYEDAKRLKEVFEGLRYQVVVQEDLKAEEIKTRIRGIAAGLVTKKHDSFICCILSRGNSEGIEGVDHKTVTVPELANIVNSKECSALHGKPKIFLFQGDRGTEIPEPSTVDSSMPWPPKEEEKVADGTARALPPEADFLFGFSTSDGNVAARGVYSGSQYIKAVCEFLDPKYSSRLSLDELLLLVNDKISGNPIDFKLLPPYKYHQMPEIRSTLRKKFYFKK